MIYPLDPDFRKDANPDKPFCVRCQKELHGTSRVVTVLVNWDTWEVREVFDSLELMGMNCWKTISKGDNHGLYR